MKTFLAFYQDMGPALWLLVAMTFAGRCGQGSDWPGPSDHRHGPARSGYGTVAGCRTADPSFHRHQPLAVGLWGHLRGLLRRLGPLLLMILAGTLIGSAWLGIDSGPWAAHALGGALLLYAVYGLSGPTMKVRPAWEVWLGPLCGLVTGLVTAATGVFVMPAVPYLQSLGLSRDEMVQALGLSFTVSTLALALGLAGQDALGGQTLGASLLMLVPALLGMLGGQWLRQRISAQVFKRCFFIGLALLGGHLLLNG